MGKRDRRRGFQITRFALEGDLIHGSQIEAGTIGAAVDLGYISANLARIDSLELVHMHLTGPNGAYLEVGNVGAGQPLRFLFAGDNGVPLVHMRAGAEPAVTLGPPDALGNPPIRIYSDRAEIDVKVLVCGDLARTLLTGDYIWVGTTEDPDAPTATGMYMGSSGLWAKSVGELSFSISSWTGWVRVGRNQRVILNPDGLMVTVSTDGPDPDENDAGVRFILPDSLEVVGGLVMDANLVEGQQYINLFGTPPSGKYMELNLGLLQSGVFGGLQVSGWGGGDTVDLTTTRVGNLALGNDMVSLRANKGTEVMEVHHAYEGAGQGLLHGRIRLAERLYTHPTSPAALAIGELSWCAAGGVARLYLRTSETELHYWEADGVIQ